MSVLSRRRFLGGAAGCWLPAGLRRLADAPLAAAFAGVVLDPKSAARLGHRCLAERPEWPRDARALSRLVLPGACERGAFLVAAPARRRQLLRERIAEDFAAGRTMEVGGWVLAETESLVAAMLAVRPA